MNIKQIKSQAFNLLTFERGVDYYEAGHVQNYHLNISNTISLAAEVIGSLNNIYQVSCEINRDDSLETSNCQCNAFQTYKGCCKHLIALLLNYYYDIDNKVTNFSTKLTKTDKFAANMIASYTKRSINDILNTDYQVVNLIPRLEINYTGKLLMSFMIGHVKPYIIKNIGKFYYDLKDNNVTEYGKNLTFYHHINNFTADSKPLVTYLINTYIETQYLQNNTTPYLKNDDRYLVISPSAFDKFFELYQTKTIQFLINGQDKLIKFTNDKPNLELTIAPQKDAFLLSLNVSDILIIKGESYQYLLIENELFALKNEAIDKIEYLLQAFKEKKAPLLISHNDMSSFYINVLELIKDTMNINTDDAVLREFEPIPLTSKLYIDIEINEVVSARLKFCYDNYEFDAFDDMQINNIYRNTKEELIIKRIVNKYFEVESKVNKKFYIYNNEMILKLYYEGVEELARYSQIYISDSFKAIIRKKPQIKIGVKIANNLLNLDIESEFTSEELLEILKTYKHNKKYYRFKDGSFINLDDNSLSEFIQIAEGLDLNFNSVKNNKYSVPMYRAMYLDNILKASKYVNSERDNSYKEIVRDIKNVDDTQFNIPESLKMVLRKYQKTGFRWLKTLNYYHFGGILADDMGLGKTIQVITLIKSYLEEDLNPLPSLVVCPASLILNWEVEFKTFAPDIKTVNIIGTQDNRLQLINNLTSYQVLITSYDYLKRDIDYYHDLTFMYHIIDEAQYIKNHSTLNSRSVKLIKSNNRFALTGTPVENNLAEIWSLFDFVMPGYLFSYNKFNKEFEVPIVKENNIEVLNKLKKLVTPFILRRLKKDVLKELPDKIESIMYVNLEGEQERLYRANLEIIKHEVKSRVAKGNYKKDKLMILSMLTRLRQLCCDPNLYYDNYCGESAKLEMCVELINTSIASGHKILLFSQFTSMLSIIEKRLNQEQISSYLLIGNTKKEIRKDLVDKFNTDNTSVFLISLRAGGTGLNLTSADVVIHYDPWWNLSVQNQATDRTHRIGQTKKVQVYQLIAKNTIEEKIMELQLAKRKLAESIIIEDEGIITKMTDEEIISLFS